MIAVCFGHKPMRSDGCFQIARKVISTFTLWIWLKNSKISLKGILLFRVRVAREKVTENEGILAREG